MPVLSPRHQEHATTASSSHGTRASSFSSPPSPELSLPSLPGSPHPALTPCNTFASDQDAAGSGTVRQVRFDENLDDDERGWFDEDDIAGEDLDDECDVASPETASLASSHSHLNLVAGPAWPWHTEQALTSRRVSYPHSSSWLPRAMSMSDPVLSSLSPADSDAPPDCTRQKKRARFDDDSISNDLLMRRHSIGSSRLRRRSAPPAPPSRGESYVSLVALQQNDHSSLRLTGYTDSEREEIAEDAAAVGIFEEVVDELVDVADEQAEEQDSLQQIAEQVRHTIHEDRAEEVKAEPEAQQEGSGSDCLSMGSSKAGVTLSRSVTDDEPMLGLSTCEVRSKALNRSCSADDNVDESVIACADETETQDDLADDDDEELKHDLASQHLMDDGSPDSQSPVSQTAAEEESESSAETARINLYASRNSSPESVELPKRRVSDSQAHTSLLTQQHDQLKQRRASMTDFCAIKGILKLPAKARPAGVVVSATGMRVAEIPRLGTVYESASASKGRIDAPDRSFKTAHTIRSDAGVLQMLWEEPAQTHTGSSASLTENSTASVPVHSGSYTRNVSPAPAPSSPTPMDKVKTKLAAWHWARENCLTTEDHFNIRLPLLPTNHLGISQTSSQQHSPRLEMPWTPPNTERSSGPTSAKHSQPHSRWCSEERVEEEADDEDDQLPELKVRATFSPDYATAVTDTTEQHHTAAISRQLSNLAAEDAHFKTHRDSVEILRKHGAEEGHKNINQKLLDTQDSFVLTRGKMGKGKKTERLRGLSPIWDASPPNNAGRVGFEDAMLRMDVERKDEAERRADPEDFKGTYSEPGWEGSHPPEHVGCPIYEVERPRWFEGRHGRKLGT